jgi:hypothetical protein
MAIHQFISSVHFLFNCIYSFKMYTDVHRNVQFRFLSFIFIAVLSCDGQCIQFHVDNLATFHLLQVQLKKNNVFNIDSGKKRTSYGTLFADSRYICSVKGPAETEMFLQHILVHFQHCSRWRLKRNAIT